MAATSIQLVGHEARWNALLNAFGKGIVPQTLLISGARHVGKTTLVKRFAQLLMCPNVDKSSTRIAPCLSCRTCHQIEIETFPDFKVYRPIVSAEKEESKRVVAPEALEGSILTVQMAREFGDEAIRRPQIGAHKVMVLVQAERMEEEGQNALLKTFEEPIKGLCIVLLCENPQRLLPTVLSRCWHLPLSLAPQREIEGWLRNEFPQAHEETIASVVAAAHGRPGAARRAMNRLDENSDTPLRSEQMAHFVDRVERAHPVAALRLTEDALRLSKEWWSEDEAGEGAASLKKGDAKIGRSQVARFLDEMSVEYQLRWQSAAQAEAQVEARTESSTRNVGAWADGLDQIRKTRHYILRNVNTNLALDVMFGRLIRQANEPNAGRENNRYNTQSSRR
ncbi:MAG TPA: hypothetical protein VM821_04620 [Abditibacteriaceae bacterium]|jgi:DNA polymerase III gamma/tau subunit|nr:hypothetical protein [Abditibacteriaceae bacterium]